MPSSRENLAIGIPKRHRREEERFSLHQSREVVGRTQFIALGVHGDPIAYLPPR